MTQKKKKENLPLSDNLHETLLIVLLVLFLCVSFFYIFSEIKAPLFQSQIQLNIVPQNTSARNPYQYKNYHDSLAHLAAHRDQLVHDDFIRVLAQVDSLKNLIETAVRDHKWDSRISYFRKKNKKDITVTQEDMWGRLKKIIVSQIDKDNQAILITLSDRNALLVEALTNQLPKIYQGILDRRHLNHDVTQAYEQTIKTDLEQQKKAALVMVLQPKTTGDTAEPSLMTTEVIQKKKELLSRQLKELQDIVVSENKYIPTFLGQHLGMNALYKDIVQNKKVLVTMQQANDVQSASYRNAENNLKLLQSLFNSEVKTSMQALQKTYAQLSVASQDQLALYAKQNRALINPELLNSMRLAGISWPVGHLSSFSIQKSLSLIDADIRGLNYFVVFVFSLLLILIVFGIRYFFLSKLQAAHDVENYLHVPVLGVIPNKKKA